MHIWQKIYGKAKQLGVMEKGHMGAFLSLRLSGRYTIVIL